MPETAAAFAVVLRSGSSVLDGDGLSDGGVEVTIIVFGRLNLSHRLAKPVL